MMDRSLQLSVVVPVRDRIDDLRRCLDALATQSLDPQRFEVLVCDDGSEPAVKEPLGGVAQGSCVWPRSRLSLRFLRQPRRGPAAARNLGIAHAIAPIVVFIDSDTIPQPGCLSAIVTAFAENPDAVGVEGAVVPPRPRESPLEEAPRNDRGGVFLTANAAFRRDALLRVGGFDESFHYPAFEDVELALEIQRLGRIAWAPRAVVVHPWRRMTWRAAAWRVRYGDSLLRVALRHGCLGWKEHATTWPRLRLAIASILTLPLGRLRDAVHFSLKCPKDVLLRVAHTLGEAALSVARLHCWLFTSPEPRRSSIREQPWLGT